MKYQLIKDLTIKTGAGEMLLQAGQIITLPHETAIRLLNEGRITPVEKVVYRIYSNILQAFLWVTENEAGADKLRAEGISEPIYTGHEIKELRKMPKEALKAIHNTKTVFEGSTVKEAGQ